MAHAQELVLRMKNHNEKILISNQKPAAPAKNGDKGRSEEGEEKEIARGMLELLAGKIFIDSRVIGNLLVFLYRVLSYVE
jgi:hypothetical protein